MPIVRIMIEIAGLLYKVGSGGVANYPSDFNRAALVVFKVMLEPDSGFGNTK